MRILGLDLGSKTIGVAISDEAALLARGVTTLSRKGDAEDLAALSRLVKEEGVGEIVVGLPLNMDGTAGSQAQAVTAFAEQMRAELKVEVVPWDERLTTLQGHRILKEADLSRRKRKTVIDRLAAQMILQSYLDFKRRG